MRHASEQRALLRRQGEVSEQRPPYASIGAMKFYKQRALPSQAGRSRLAEHTTRVGVMQTSEHSKPCRSRQSEVREQRTLRE